MRILFIGDIVGKPGRTIVHQALAGLILRESLDLVVANAENAAGGSGLTPANYHELIAAGIDAITLGDHVYRRKAICKILQEASNVVRPANLPIDAPGRTWNVVVARNGVSVGFACLLGQLFMKPVDNPFQAADVLLEAMPDDVVVRMIDYHAEATSEMQILGHYLDGRVSAVLGTHTHVPTADECILPGGTAFQCDVGMTGPYDSIIGRRIDRVMRTTLTAFPTQFEVASRDVRLCGSIVDMDSETGRALAIRRLVVTEPEARALAASAS